MLTELQLQELRPAFAFWVAIEETAGRPFPASDERTFLLFAERSARYGSLTGVKSAWNRAAFELANEGKVRLRVPPPEPTPIPANFQEMLNGLTPGQLRSKITPPPTFGKADANDLTANPVRDRAAGGYDPVFADHFARWSAGERPEGFMESDAYELTATQWRSLPPHVAAVKMRDPRFRAAVDKLIATGQI